MALVDNILVTINASLSSNLDWLDNAFGKIQVLQKKRLDGSIHRYPGIYIGEPLDNEDYKDLLPDGHLGNYCYWQIEGEEVEYQNIRRNIKPIFNFKLVFWFDLSNIYPTDFRTRSIEEVKASVLNVLTATHYVRDNASYQIFEAADDIYSGFTHQEIKQHFLERPYGGFAVTGKIIGLNACAIDLPTPTIPLNVFSSIPFTHSTEEQVWPFEKELGGAKMYVRTWDLGTGADDYENLAGLSIDTVGEIVRVEHRSRNTLTGARQVIIDVFEENTDDNVYKVYTLPSTSHNRVRIFYTKQ